MDLFDAINGRRSIRSFSAAELPRDAIEAIIKAGIEAPSAKNIQPWRFVVVEGAAKQGMLEAMKAGLDKEAAGEGFFDNAKDFIKWPGLSMRIMAQAPVTVFVVNPEAAALALPAGVPEHLAALSLTQSVGAAIQNMCLAATALGVGSLWICDVFFAMRELCAWLGTNEEIMAAVALGYTEEKPARRGRKAFEAVTEWRS